MTMSSDLSLMDFLFEREDPLQNLLDKDSLVKSESECWNGGGDEFLDSIFKFDDAINPFEILDETNDVKPFSVSDTMDMSFTTSSCSESGLSSDQQLSPMLQDADDEDAGDYQLTSSGSEGSPNPNFYSNIDSPQNEEEVEIDSAVFDMFDTQNFGEIIIEDDNDAIMKCSQSSTKEKVTLHNIKNNSLHKLIRVTPISGNPRSILLPVALKTMKDIRAIKILNPGSRTVTTKSGLKNLSKISAPLPVNESIPSSSSSKSSIISSEDESDSSQYPRLQLTSEEKRLLQKEGVRLPSHYPLTKFEERELKRIRRKIRNKISAQDSRKRKKEYIDGLEDRVKQCTEENMNLVKKIKVLQTQNQTMMTQLKRLHAALSRGSVKTAQPATCLMVLMLSMALVMMPNLGTKQNADMQAETEMTLPENDSPPIAGRSRTLLFSKPLSDEGLCFPNDVKMEEEDILGEMDDSLQFSDNLDDHDYGPPPPKLSRKEPIEYLPGSRGFIVPPVDDVWPPSDPYDLGETNNVSNKIKDYVKEFKVNISDTTGRPTRTVVVQVPKEK